METLWSEQFFMKEDLSFTSFYMEAFLYILGLYAYYASTGLWPRQNFCDCLISQNRQAKYS